jgi:hypothetical protein
LGMLFGLAFLGVGKARVRRGIARTRRLVIAGLDPAIHGASQNTYAFQLHSAIPRGPPGQARWRRKERCKTMKGKPVGTRSFPGRLTLEEWLARPSRVRNDLVRRAQCDLLGSFRFCARKPCRRERTCCGDDPGACGWRLWCLKRVKPKMLREEWSRLERLKSL